MFEMLWLCKHHKYLLHTQKRVTPCMSLCITWCMSSFHSQHAELSFLEHWLSSALLFVLLSPLLPLSLPAGPELIVFALLINLSLPQGMSHIGFWMNTGCAGTKTCPAFSNEFQPLRALGELACCDWHLLRRTVRLWNEMKAVQLKEHRVQHATMTD